MPLFTLAFLLGDLYLQTCSRLPSKIIIFSMVGIIFLFGMSLRKHGRNSYLLFAFGLGFAWSAWYASSLLAWSLPKEQEGQTLVVTGYIASLPITNPWQTNFLFALNRNALIRLAWRHPSLHFDVGDKWQLHVRLKRVHGMRNPGTFDYEGWALQNKIRATGYVVSTANNILVSKNAYRYPLNRLRQIIQEKIAARLPSSHTAPWLMALIVGERNGMAEEDWQVLRNTGTNHLMAIAGLHIGLIAGFAYGVAAWCWRRIPRLLLYIPAQEIGAYAALLMAVIYSALAGFSIPTQRACLMLAIFISTQILRRKHQPWQSWSLALFAVLLVNPLSVLTESFWLSFGTIALIIYGISGRLAPSSVWWKWGRTQWVIGLGLIPVSLFLFQQSSFISFFANSIAIPWLGFFILPFCFLSVVFLLICPSVGAVFLWLADKSLSGLWIILTWLSQLHFTSWHQTIPNTWMLIVAGIGILLLLLPAGFPGRYMGVLWLLPVILYQPPKPALGDVWLTLLDVGQGLSIVIQTKEHILVYDAGAKLNTNFDMGESVVSPYLYTLGTKQVDMLVISHADNDHRGGAAALFKNMPVRILKTSVPEQFFFKNTSDCLAGETWQWDEVNFSFIYPSQKQLHLGNDSSCVLRIDNGRQHILLTGDIEKLAENDLLDKNRQALSADILIAPHHGSKTSGLKDFIAAVRPRYVLYSVGYRNRYHFPHHSVVALYQQSGARQLSTDETGAIIFKLERDNKAIAEPILYRVVHRHYWEDD